MRPTNFFKPNEGKIITGNSLLPEKVITLCLKLHMGWTLYQLMKKTTSPSFCFENCTAVFIRTNNCLCRKGQPEQTCFDHDTSNLFQNSKCPKLRAIRLLTL